MNILLIEDDKELSALISDYLSKEGMEISTLLSGEHAVSTILKEQPDLIILDVMLPVMDGIEICKAVRADYDGIILMLTAKQEEVDQIMGLELGADDYLFKPIKPRLLLAKIKSLSRRTVQHTSHDHLTSLTFGKLHIDVAAREVLLDKNPITLTSSEFDLLVALANQAGDVLSRDDLSHLIFGREYNGLERTIDNKVSQLRKKLQDDARDSQKIKTIRSKGYLFVASNWDD